MTAGAFKLEDLEEEMHLLQAKLVAIGQKKMALLDAETSIRRDMQRVENQIQRLKQLKSTD